MTFIPATEGSFDPGAEATIPGEALSDPTLQLL